MAGLFARSHACTGFWPILHACQLRLEISYYIGTQGVMIWVRLTA